MTRDILPTLVVQGFEEYKKIYVTNAFPRLLSFAIHLSVPWILAWTFQTEEIDHIHWLVREFNIKWWANFQSERADIHAVHKWVSLNPKSTASSSCSEDFKTKKARLQMALAKASSEETSFPVFVVELKSWSSEIILWTSASEEALARAI